MQNINKTFHLSLATTTLVQESNIFVGCSKTMRFILCKNAHSIATLAKEYMIYSVMHCKILSSLAQCIMSNDNDIINKLPKNFVDRIREWLSFFQENDIPEEFKKKTAFGSSIEFRIVCPEVLHDSLYKAFIPFTSLYKLSKHENDIERMMKEITEVVYGNSFYVWVMMPITKLDTLSEPYRIALNLVNNLSQTDELDNRA